MDNISHGFTFHPEEFGSMEYPVMTGHTNHNSMATFAGSFAYPSIRPVMCQSQQMYATPYSQSHQGMNLTASTNFNIQGFPQASYTRGVEMAQNAQYHATVGTDIVPSVVMGQTRVADPVMFMAVSQAGKGVTIPGKHQSLPSFSSIYASAASNISTMPMSDAFHNHGMCLSGPHQQNPSRANTSEGLVHQFPLVRPNLQVMSQKVAQPQHCDTPVRPSCHVKSSSAGITQGSSKNMASVREYHRSPSITPSVPQHTSSPSAVSSLQMKSCSQTAISNNDLTHMRVSHQSQRGYNLCSNMDSFQGCFVAVHGALQGPVSSRPQCAESDRTRQSCSVNNQELQCNVEGPSSVFSPDLDPVSPPSVFADKDQLATPIRQEHQISSNTSPCLPSRDHTSLDQSLSALIPSSYESGTDLIEPVQSCNFVESNRDAFVRESKDTGKDQEYNHTSVSSANKSPKVFSNYKFTNTSRKGCVPFFVMGKIEHCKPKQKHAENVSLSPDKSEDSQKGVNIVRMGTDDALEIRERYVNDLESFKPDDSNGKDLQSDGADNQSDGADNQSDGADNQSDGDDIRDNADNIPHASNGTQSDGEDIQSVGEDIQSQAESIQVDGEDIQSENCPGFTGSPQNLRTDCVDEHSQHADNFSETNCKSDSCPPGNNKPERCSKAIVSTLSSEKATFVTVSIVNKTLNNGKKNQTGRRFEDEDESSSRSSNVNSSKTSYRPDKTTDCSVGENVSQTVPGQSGVSMELLSKPSLDTTRTEVKIRIEDSQCIVVDNQKRWKCNLCDKSYTTKNNLVTHILDHQGIKPHSCLICGRSFKQLSHLNTHMLTHDKIKPHVCQHCGKGFTQVSHLKRHQVVHMIKKPYICDVCQRGFTYPSELKTHKDRHVNSQCRPLLTPGDNPQTEVQQEQLPSMMDTGNDVRCKHCNKIFKYPSQLRDHMSSHSTTRPYVCGECGLDFVKEHHLRAHQFTHTGAKPFGCHVCGRAFNQKANMQRHLLIHNSERGFKCKICGKTFTQPQTLKAHIVIHADRKPFQCKLCGKEFGRLHNLQGHMHMHGNSKPYVCFCGCSFTLKGNLNRHKKVKHGLNESTESMEEEAVQLLKSLSERAREERRQIPKQEEHFITGSTEDNTKQNIQHHDTGDVENCTIEEETSHHPRKQRKSTPRKVVTGGHNTNSEPLDYNPPHSPEGTQVSRYFTKGALGLHEISPKVKSKSNRTQKRSKFASEHFVIHSGTRCVSTYQRFANDNELLNVEKSTDRQIPVQKRPPKKKRRLSGKEAKLASILAEKFCEM